MVIPTTKGWASSREQRDSATVQVLGMDQSRAAEADYTSGASTSQGDYGVTRAYIPSHHSTASRLQKQSSFSTGASQSSSGSEAHHEPPSAPRRSADPYDASTIRATAPSSTVSSRRALISHSHRGLSHKDSFGGSYGFNTGAELSSESADETFVSPYLGSSQRLASAYADDGSSEGHYRDNSLSRPAQRSNDPARIAHTLSSYHSVHGSGASDLTEPIEVLGRPSAFSDSAASHTSRSMSSALPASQSRTALSAAAAAATSQIDNDLADATFAAKFDHSLALDATSHHSKRLVEADSLSDGQDVQGLPGAAAVASSQDDNTTPSASSRDLRRSEAASDDASTAMAVQRKQQSASIPTASSQTRDRRDRSDRDRSLASSSRRPASSRQREPAASSGSARPDATRSLKTSYRTLPQLPSASSVRPAPPPAMYWSKAPVHGSVPRRSFRAHTANLCDEVLWLFGGCDNRGCFRDLWCFDTETMCWSKPKVTGDIPPARRAHSATMVNKRLFVFAGGDGPHYFNDLYIFDTISLRWSKPEVGGTAPSPRRAHTCNYYEGQLIVFGGGNGVGALNDVHTLDVNDLSRLEWRRMECSGKVPIGRGYHTSNLVDGKLIVIGGSDGHMSFNDIHILRLETRTWYQVKTDEIHNRLGHTATQVGSYLFIFGGHDSKTYTSELLTLNLVNLQWEPRKVCGKKPQGRGYHQAWLRDSRLFVHGGFDGKDIFDDLHFLDLAACAYLPQITSFSVELDDEE